ncbi:MAG: hypothetical protein BroJett040_00930 [Oligoflexia bacterium]|nr:MAG: hypothetical protein BroJett040_00930 [Oligoflexia bacterium]
MANTGLHLLTFSSALVIGFSMTHQSGLKKIFAPVNVFLGLCFVFGLFGHFYFNKLYFGSWELTIKDLWEAFLFRTNQCENAEVCGLGWKEFIQFPLIILRRIERYFLIPGPAIVVFFLLMRRKLKTENPVLLSYAWSLLVAGLFWFAIMPQHAWVHHFTGRDVAIFVGLTGAYGLTEYARILKRDFELQKLWPKVYHSLFVFYLVGMALTQQALPMYWRDSFAHLFK